MRFHEIAEQPSLIKRQLAWCSVFTRCYVLPKCSYLNDKSPSIPLSPSLPVCTSLLQCCVSQPWPKKKSMSSSLWVKSVFLEMCCFTIWSHTKTFFFNFIIILQDKSHRLHIFETWQSLVEPPTMATKTKDAFNLNFWGISTRWWHCQLCHSISFIKTLRCFFQLPQWSEDFWFQRNTNLNSEQFRSLIHWVLIHREEIKKQPQLSKSFHPPRTQTVSKTSSSEEKKNPSDCKPDVIDVIWYPVKSTNVLNLPCVCFQQTLKWDLFFRRLSDSRHHKVKKPRRPAALDWLAHWAEAFTLSVSKNIYHRRARMRSCKQWGGKPDESQKLNTRAHFAHPVLSAVGKWLMTLLQNFLHCNKGSASGQHRTRSKVKDCYYQG